MRGPPVWAISLLPGGRLSDSPPWEKRFNDQSVMDNGRGPGAQSTLHLNEIDLNSLYVCLDESFYQVTKASLNSVGYVS